MNKVILLLAALGAIPALADGFVCQSTDGDLTVKVYNHTNTESGTRNSAVLVLSDPRVSVGRKTIATFSDAQGLLGNSGATYSANVDLRFSTTSRKGERIGGTKLGELDEIILEVNFSYAQPMAAGEETQGLLSLVKRTGDRKVIQLGCERYLKN